MNTISAIGSEPVGDLLPSQKLKFSYWAKDHENFGFHGSICQGESGCADFSKVQ